MGNLVKTVEMRVLADAGDAQAKLDDLDAKAKDIDGNAIKMRFRLDDGDAKGQLDAIKAKADELGYKDVSLKVRVDGAGRAVAELEAVKEAAKAADSTGGGGGLLSKLFGGLSSAGSALPLVGGLGPAAIPVLAAGLAALVPEVVAVASGFAAAGAGAGAFAALAMPAVKSVESAYTSLNTAQQAYNAAAAKDAADPTKTNNTALASAALNLKLAQETISKLPGPEQSAIKGIQGLTSEFSKMSKAFQPQAFKVFTDALKVANNLLPTLTPFANTFATSIDGLLKRLVTFTAIPKQMSKADWEKLPPFLKGQTLPPPPTGWQTFLDSFHKLEGPAIGAIGDGIGKVTTALGQLMTTFSGKDVAHAINIAFGAIAGTISGIRYAIMGLKTAWDSLSQNSTFKRIASEFTTAWNEISTTGKKKPDFSGLVTAVKDAVSTAISWLNQKLTPLINSALHTAANWLSKNASQVLAPIGKAIMQGLISGMESQLPNLLSLAAHIAVVIAEHKGPIEYDRILLVPHGQAIMEGLVKGINSKKAALHKSVVTIAASILTDLQGGQSAITAAEKAAGNTVAGPDSTIAGAIAKLEADVKGHAALTKWLKSENTQLQGLAAERAKIEAEIADSEQVAQSEIANASVMNAATAGPVDGAVPLTTSQIITGMQYQRDQLRQFAQQVAQLQKMGLNATSLSQITGAGTSAGLPVAQALTSGGKAAIAQMNQLQSQIKGAADKLGDAAAPSMYQAGVEAAQGLASGLKSQLSSLDKAMGELATSIVNAIRKALKSHSPSLVMAEVGLSIPQGLAMGIEQGAAVAVSASTRLAARTVAPWAGAGHGGGGGNIEVHFNGLVTSPQDTARQVVQVLKEYKRNGGNAALGIA